MNRLEGCRIEPLDDKACRAVLQWAAGGEPVEGDHDFAWLLAHCRDGVTWGRSDGAARSWLTSSSPFPDLCPAITGANLLEMRLFGPERETLIWRTDTGFSGRCLSDEPVHGKDSPARPDDREIRILLGDRLVDGPRDGFTRVGTASGAQQAVPLVCAASDFKDKRRPLRLKVRHYFEQDEQTGAVRVAATRLVHVY
jgi:CRISPR-associated protein (TIGR03984 family)